jgi:hypothetical protein
MVSTQVFNVDEETYRRVHCWESTEVLEEENQKEFLKELWEHAESRGIPTTGEHCQHQYEASREALQFDCCGRFYAGFLTVMYIDWSYGQVFTYQMFHRNS